MAMSSKISALALAACALLGCGTVNKNIGSEDPALGESVKYDSAMQVINPMPVYTAEGAQPGDNGAKGVAAIKRYRNDTVKQVEQMQTTSGSGGSGSSGSSPH
jgi:hypothetical protein